MAPTETLNLVVAPDLAQDELPFLEHLGFRQAFTPLAPLHHIKRTKPPLDDARRRASRSASRIDEIKEDDDIASAASSRRASSSTAHSSGSSECAPASAKSRPSKTQGAPAQRTLSATELELQASRITNFISRMRYLTDEGNNQEFTPGVFPPGGSLAGRRSMIKAHAERVKNQLELKFQVIPYFFELDKYLDNASGARERAAYNPLQIIRDRNIRPSERQSKHFQRQNIWQIPVSEMVQDMRWHYQSTKLRAQKMKRRQMKAGSISSGDADFHSASEAARENEHATDNEGSPAPAKITPAEWQTPEQHGAPRAQHATPQFSNPFVSGNKRRQSQASEGPTLNLPETSCGELIQRMRSSHGAPEGSNSSSSGSRHSSFNESLEVDPLSQQSQPSQTSQHQPSSFSRQFCRNTASVMDSKNRLRGSNASTDQVECSRLGDDDLLKPLSRVQTNNSQTLSMHSSRSSMPEIFNFEAASSSSLSLDQATQAIPAQKGPVLTVTSDSGEQKLLDPLKRTPRATNLGTLRQSSPQKGGDAAHKGVPSMAISSDDSMNDPGNICTFGSIRPGHGDVRKAPWERAAHTAEEELEYHILLFKTALRRESLASVRERACRKNTSQDVCDRVSAELKNEGVPQFLGYLSGVEHNVVKQQQILDADFASSLDALRVTTDRMVSEVNTTLNKQVRELSSRMDKVTSARNCGICTNASYTLLEYVVLSLMWVIWSVVKLWRFLCGSFHMLRGGCSMFVIA